MKGTSLILIIDDDPVFGKTFKRHIENGGFKEVIQMESVAESIYHVEVVPDVLFVDYNLEDITGVDAIKIYRKKWPFALIILISGSESLLRYRPYHLSKYKIDGVVLKSQGYKAMLQYAIKRSRYKLMKKIAFYFLLPITFLGLLIWLYL
jgi:CheY-like chemotaxis protein